LKINRVWEAKIIKSILPVAVGLLFSLPFLVNPNVRAQTAEAQVILLGTGTPYPVRDYEAILEITYQAEIKPGFLVQPVFQYIAHPAGGAVDPNDPSQTRRIKDAVMLGVRSTITY